MLNFYVLGEGSAALNSYSKSAWLAVVILVFLERIKI